MLRSGPKHINYLHPLAENKKGGAFLLALTHGWHVSWKNMQIVLTIVFRNLYLPVFLASPTTCSIFKVTVWAFWEPENNIKYIYIYTYLYTCILWLSEWLLRRNASKLASQINTEHSTDRKLVKKFRPKWDSNPAIPVPPLISQLLKLCV